MTPWDKFLELSKNGTADIRWVDGQWLDMAGVIRVQNARGHKFYIRILTKFLGCKPLEPVSWAGYHKIKIPWN
jgi:hypothetical protein